jgi:hypothetical protein
MISNKKKHLKRRVKSTLPKNFKVKNDLDEFLGIESLPSRHFNKKQFKKMDDQLKIDIVDAYLTYTNIGL